MGLHCLQLVVLATLFSGSSTWLTNSIGVLVPKSLKILSGETVKLSCTLTSSDGFNNSHLYFYIPQAGQNNVPIDQQYYRTEGQKTLLLEYPNVTESGRYVIYCSLNKSSVGLNDVMIGSAEVLVGIWLYSRPTLVTQTPEVKTTAIKQVTLSSGYHGLPSPVTNITVVSFNFQNMVVYWYPCELYVTYTLYWSIRNASGENGTASHINANCSYTLPQAQFFTFQTYDITISASNAFGANDNVSQTIYSGPNIVKPNRVRNLTATVLNSTSISWSWLYPDGLHDTWFYLTFRLFLASKWSGSDKMIDVGNVTSFIVTNLTPFTLYNITVRCKPVDGGYWSDDTSVTATTPQDAPASAPELPAGWFRTGSCNSNSKNCTVTLFWQQIPEYKRNGIITKFRLNVRETNLSYEKSGDSNTFSMQIPISTDKHKYWIGVQAATDIGWSPMNFMLVSLNSSGIPSLENLYMESTEDGNGVLLSWGDKNLGSFDNFTVIYCEGVQYENDVCQTDPVNIVVPGNQTNVTLSNVKSNWVFSVAGNTKDGSLGLSNMWLCKYEYYASPVAPELLPPDIGDESLLIRWTRLECDSKNRARVLWYILEYTDNPTGKLTVNVSASESQYLIPDLQPKTQYNISLKADSRMGNGPASSTEYTTMAPPTNVTMIVAITVVVGSVLIALIVLIIICCRHKYGEIKKWCQLKIIVPPQNDAKLQSVTSISDPPVNNGDATFGAKDSAGYSQLHHILAVNHNGNITHQTLPSNHYDVLDDSVSGTADAPRVNGGVDTGNSAEWNIPVNNHVNGIHATNTNGNTVHLALQHGQLDTSDTTESNPGVPHGVLVLNVYDNSVDGIYDNNVDGTADTVLPHCSSASDIHDSDINSSVHVPRDIETKSRSSALNCGHESDNPAESSGLSHVSSAQTSSPSDCTSVNSSYAKAGPAESGSAYSFANTPPQPVKWIDSELGSAEVYDEAPAAPAAGENDEEQFDEGESQVTDGYARVAPAAGENDEEQFDEDNHSDSDHSSLGADNAYALVTAADGQPSLSRSSDNDEPLMDSGGSAMSEYEGTSCATASSGYRQVALEAATVPVPDGLAAEPQFADWTSDGEGFDSSGGGGRSSLTPTHHRQPSDKLPADDIELNDISNMLPLASSDSSVADCSMQDTDQTAC